MASAGNPPPEVRARIDEYLAQIAKSASRHHLTGYLFDATGSRDQPVLVATPLDRKQHRR